MSLRFVDEVKEDIVDASTDWCTEVEEFSVYSVQSGLQEITFSRIFRVEKFEKIEHESLLNVSLREVCVEIRALDESQEELINDF